MDTNLCETYCGPPPSYIRAVLRDNNIITLVSRKVPKYLSCKLEDMVAADASNLTLDLTGNPLVVDLPTDMTLSVAVSKWNNWTEAESNHHPLCLNEARKIINDFNNKKIKNENGSTSTVYCVCDGTNKRCIVVLGSSVSASFFCRTEINVRGCCALSDMSVEAMLQEHNETVANSNAKTDTVVTSLYSMYGYDLKNCNTLNAVEYNGSILLDVSWNSHQYSVPSYVNSMELTLQVITGHRNSQIDVFWEQLTILNNYMAINTTIISNLDNVCLSNSPDNYTKISAEVCGLLYVQRPVLKERTEKGKLNLENKRDENFLDKLWTILVRCRDVADVRICLNVLFDELADDKSIKVNIPESNKSWIASKIGEVLSGKATIPTLSSGQALQCLIELGLEKLKNDYFYLLNHFDCLNYESLERYWNKMRVDGTQEASNARIPRVTILPTTSIVNASEIASKFSFLASMHTALDFLLLAQRFNYISRETSDYIVQYVFDQHLDLKSPVKLLEELPQCLLRELKLNLKSTNGSFLQGMNPVAWNLNLTTVNKRSMVSTTFHLSRQPVFPPSIYDNYGANITSDSDGVTYCVTKAVTYSD